MRQEIPSCGLPACTKVQDKMRPHNYDGDAGEAKGFAVARGSKIAHTVSIETIEYGPAGVWHAASAACDLAMRKG